MVEVRAPSKFLPVCNVLVMVVHICINVDFSQEKKEPRNARKNQEGQRNL